MEFEWLSENDKIQGFQWRGGSDRVTTGIQIWSKPFVCENKFGEKVSYTNFLKMFRQMVQIFYGVVIFSKWDNDIWKKDLKHIK